MKALRLLLLPLLALFGLSGCLDVEKTITVNPDGSGTVVETVLMSKAALEQMKEMAQGFGGKGGAGADALNLADENKAREEAAKMGEGVTLVSVKKISNEKGEGAVMTYSFKDITKLKVDQNPASAGPKMGGGQQSKAEPVLFTFSKGNPSQLTIKMSQGLLDKAAANAGEQAKDAPEADGMEDMAMEMMKQMFKDMRISINVAVAGKISQTNAQYHDDSRVTLMEMDMNKLLANPEKLKAMAKSKPETLEAMKAVVKGIDGIKVESAPEVTIKFK